jgi:hypothetical protein
MLAVENITVNTAIQVRTPPAVTPLVVCASGETGATTGFAGVRAEYSQRNQICLGFAWARGDNLS